jgi:hypothetical protein
LDEYAPPPPLRRYTVYLKDGRMAEALGVRLDPNVERVFQGQTRSFVIVSDGRTETAVFVAGDVLGWTVAAGPEPSSNGHVAAVLPRAASPFPPAAAGETPPEAPAVTAYPSPSPFLGG